MRNRPGVINSGACRFMKTSSGRIKKRRFFNCLKSSASIGRPLTSLERARAKHMSALPWPSPLANQPSLSARKSPNRLGDGPRSTSENQYLLLDTNCLGLEILRLEDGSTIVRVRTFSDAQSASAAFPWILSHPAHTTRAGFIVSNLSGPRPATVTFLSIRPSGKLFSMKFTVQTD